MDIVSILGFHDQTLPANHTSHMHGAYPTCRNSQGNMCPHRQITKKIMSLAS